MKSWNAWSRPTDFRWATTFGSMAFASSRVPWSCGAGLTGSGEEAAGPDSAGGAVLRQPAVTAQGDSATRTIAARRSHFMERMISRPAGGRTSATWRTCLPRTGKLRPPVQLVIAEKPSVARDLARVLGLRGAGKHALEGSGRVITWCIGHLVELEEPAAYDPAWKAWRLDTLPMLPAAFKLRPVPSTRDQLRAVRDLLRDRRFDEVVNACDAGREGELIFRYVYELAGSRLPIKRLWISSLTDEAIRAGFARLRPGVELDAARRRRALPLGGRLARRHERHPRRHGELAGRRAPPPPGAPAAPRPARTERLAALFDRPRADADAGDPGAAGAGDPAVPAA